MARNLRRSSIFAGLLLAGLLCLIFPIAAKCDQPIPNDIRDSAFQHEISSVLRLGYMNMVGDNSFKPDGKIKAKDFMTCISRGAEKTGIKLVSTADASKPNSFLTRQEAVKLLVSSLVTPDKVDQIVLMCGGCTREAGGFNKIKFG